jgi:hypothetical protein
MVVIRARGRVGHVVAVILGLVAPPAVARGDEPPPSAETTAEDETSLKARADFVLGTELVQQAKWSEALAAFERAAALRPHAITSYNMGACLRAMGRYVLARKRFLEALVQDEALQGTQLSATLRDDLTAILRQIEDDTLARARITMKPATATIAIDGRPLEPHETDGPRPVLLAGTLPAGPGRRPPAAEFDVLLDPGPHVITLSRKGYSDAVVPQTVEPGETVELELVIERLRARMKIDADPDGAVVAVDGVDVGAAPVDLRRSAGTYRVVVQKDGYVPYEQEVALAAGQEVDIRAELPVEPPALHERWWFWTTLAGAAASVVVTTLVVVYDPQREPCNGGGLGWCVEVP